MKSNNNSTGFVARFLILFALTTTASYGQSGAAMLRIDCSGKNLGAEVYVDGKFRGECPVDIQVQEGIRKLRFYQKVDQRFERVQEQELRIGAATVKRIEVLLPDARLNDEARREEDERNLRLKVQAEEIKQKELAIAESKRLEAIRLEEELKQRDESQFRIDLAGAQSGQVDSQFIVGVKYRYGIGVNFNEVESRAWLGAAAKAGHIAAEILQHGSEIPLPLKEKPKELRAIYEEIIQFSQSQTAIRTDASALQFENNLKKLPIFSPWYERSSPWSNPSLDMRYYMGGMITLVDEEILGSIFSQTRYQRKLEKILSVYGDTDKSIFFQSGFFGGKSVYVDTVKSQSIESRSILNLICKRIPSKVEKAAIEFVCLTSYTLLSSDKTRIARFKTVYENTNTVRFRDNPFSIVSIYRNGLLN